MNCKKCQGLYLLSLDRELISGEKLSMDQHIRQCLGCQAQIKAFQEISSRMEAAEKITPSEKTLEKIREKAYQAAKAPQRQKLFSLPKLKINFPDLAYSFVSVAVIAIIIALFVPNRQPVQLTVSRREKKPVYSDSNQVERYLKNTYVDKTKEVIENSFIAVKQTREALTSTTPGYGYSLQIEPESLAVAITNLEEQIKEIM